MPKINFQGRELDAVDVDFQIRKEDWNEYQAMDGSIIKMKLVVSGILRVQGEYDAEGNPVYVVRSQNLMVVKAPDVLRKKP